MIISISKNTNNVYILNKNGRKKGMENELDKYFLEAVSYEEIKDDCYVIFDTNVLLNIYRWKKITLDELFETLEHLYENDILKFSLQVIEEFSKNRPGIIAKSIEDIDNEINSFSSPRHINKLSPVLEEHPKIDKINEIRSKYMDSQSEYRKELKELKEEVKKLYIHDPFIDRIKKFSKGNVIKIYDEKYINAAEKEGQKRYQNNIPPGYEDKGKKVNKFGDYFIWKDLISLNKNVIFVTFDNKKDWVVADNNGKVLAPLPELQQEFYDKTGGKNIAIYPPDEFLKKYKPTIKEAVIKEIQSSSAQSMVNLKRALTENIELLSTLNDAELQQIKNMNLNLQNTVDYSALRQMLQNYKNLEHVINNPAIDQIKKNHENFERMMNNPALKKIREIEEFLDSINNQVNPDILDDHSDIDDSLDDTDSEESDNKN